MSVNIAKLVATNFKKFGGPVGVGPAVLHKITPGIRMPGAASDGTNPTTQDFAATGFVSDYKAYQIDGTIIRSGDRQVTLFGASIAGGAVPVPNDRVTIDNETLTIVGPIGRDSAKAAYVLQCRA